jgi:hypothetical protein
MANDHDLVVAVQALDAEFTTQYVEDQIDATTGDGSAGNTAKRAMKRYFLLKRVNSLMRDGAGMPPRGGGRGRGRGGGRGGGRGAGEAPATTAGHVSCVGNWVASLQHAPKGTLPRRKSTRTGKLSERGRTFRNRLASFRVR